MNRTNNSSLSVRPFPRVFISMLMVHWTIYNMHDYLRLLTSALSLNLFILFTPNQWWIADQSCRKDTRLRAKLNPLVQTKNRYYAFLISRLHSFTRISKCILDSFVFVYQFVKFQVNPFWIHRPRILLPCHWYTRFSPLDVTENQATLTSDLVTLTCCSCQPLLWQFPVSALSKWRTSQVL